MFNMQSCREVLFNMAQHWSLAQKGSKIVSLDDFVKAFRE